MAWASIALVGRNRTMRCHGRRRWVRSKKAQGTKSSQRTGKWYRLVLSSHLSAVPLKRPTWEWKSCLVARKNIVSGSWQSIFIKNEGRREPRRGAILGFSPSGGWLRVGRGGGCYSASGLGRARHQAQPTESMGGSRESRPWALMHVMPSPATVSGRLKTASKAAISGLPFTVSFLFGVVTVIYI